MTQKVQANSNIKYMLKRGTFQKRKVTIYFNELKKCVLPLKLPKYKNN